MRANQMARALQRQLTLIRSRLRGGIGRAFGTLLILGMVLVACGPSRVSADVKPEARMLRYPDVGKSHIVFLYANNLWLVPREGGQASPLTTVDGEELFPRFSPDSQTVAFVGSYEEGRDLYTVATTGGIPQRITYHPAVEILCDWTPAGELLFATNGFAGLQRMLQLYTVSADAPLPKQMPVAYGSNGAISPDGVWLAYTPYSRDTRTWKRYQGGMASDIWLFNLNKKDGSEDYRLGGHRHVAHVAWPDSLLPVGCRPAAPVEHLVLRHSHRRSTADYRVFGLRRKVAIDRARGSWTGGNRISIRR